MSTLLLISALVGVLAGLNWYGRYAKRRSEEIRRSFEPHEPGYDLKQMDFANWRLAYWLVRGSFYVFGAAAVLVFSFYLFSVV